MNKKRDKIIIINHYGITPDMPGATKHYDLATYFASKKEYDIEFWMCGYNHATGKYAEGLKGLHIQHIYSENDIKIVKIKSVPDWNSLIMRQLNIMVFDFITGIKLLFSRNIKCIILSMPPITFFTSDAAYIRKIKMVADVEDLWPLFMKEMGMNNKLAETYMEHYANRSYNRANAIEAVSNGMLEYVKNKVKNKNKIMWLAPLGVNLKLVKGETNRQYIGNYEWKNDFIIMYAGAHGRANDIESLLKMIQIFNQKYKNIDNRKVSFVFLGNGDNKEKLQQLKKQYGLSNTYFEDAVPGSIVPQILKNADVCLTNLKKVESFKLVRPNKIFQYMAASKPIICGIWGEAAEIVETAKAGIYIDFENPNAADQIYDFLINEDLKECGKNGYEYVSKYGNRDIIFEDFYERIRALLG